MKKKAAEKMTFENGFSEKRGPGAQKLSFTQDNGPVDECIDNLITLAGGIKRTTYVREMILAALKAGQEDSGHADLKMMNTTLKELRFTAKIFGDYRSKRKVAVFGSARTKPDHPIYQMALKFGERAAGSGFMVITGGGPGIMQATNEGAGSDHSFGVSIRLPMEQLSNNTLKNNPRVINYKYFFNRKVAFLSQADAVALFPGGFGTLDEAMETATLVQTGKHAPLPILLLEPPGGNYWPQFLEFLSRELLPGRYIDAGDLTLLERFDSADGAMARISAFYRRYHSLRHIGKQLAIRLLTPLNQPQVKMLSEDFSDILRKPDGMVLSGPLPAEADEPEISHLPRLIVDFNRKDYSRLRQLIDAVNAF
jgi:uncharacterized protein (TIGR00730 family)